MKGPHRSALLCTFVFLIAKCCFFLSLHLVISDFFWLSFPSVSFILWLATSCLLLLLPVYSFLIFVFPSNPECGFLTNTEAPARLPQRANSNLDPAQQYGCQEGGCRWDCTKTKQNGTKPKNMKLDLILTQKENLRRICGKLAQSFFEDRFFSNCLTVDA